MFLLNTQNNFYIILSSYVEGNEKKKSSLNFMCLVCFQTSKIWIFGGKLFWWASLEIIFQKSLLFFDFLLVFNMVWKNQKCWNFWWYGFCSNKHSKMQKIFANIFFGVFEMQLSIYKLFEILNLLFLISHLAWHC